MSVPTPAVDPTPTPVTPAVEPKAPETEPLGEGGIKALQAEREARAAAEAETARLKAIVDEAEAAKLSDIERAQKAAADAAAEADRLRLDNARLAALAAHPVPAEYQDLVVGTDAESFASSAKRISELLASRGVKADPVRESGMNPGGGSDSKSGGSIAAGREMFAAKSSKKKEG